MPQPTFLTMSALASGTREPVRRRVPVNSQINASALGRRSRSRSREGLTAEIAIASLFFERIYCLPIYCLPIYICGIYISSDSRLVNGSSESGVYRMGPAITVSLLRRLL